MATRAVQRQRMKTNVWSLEDASTILKQVSPQLPVLEVEGASHHAWTHPTKASDQASVVKARGIIRKQVSAWLAEE